ncbi:glycosyltransferase [Alkalinema sp. FACHB-956]|uniref:glycosyltransferase family 4 protein n=1 Tax=Alkalinema sp. FACHB-956 TaxID=2692768 RepID=UPI001683EA73|nr:glycosyltransferase [Alkalinema sp. FACHB-956]MBD2327260.1 glycosyltransferase [Alkalinema sp. FACHB-956]
MKILLSAYACEPNRGSEPGVGWNVALALAQYSGTHHQVYVLTTAAHRSGIEAELAHNPQPNLTVIYLDPFDWVYDWSQEGKHYTWAVNLHYYLWQVKAYLVARSLHKLHQFDIAQHVTYVRYYNPSFLALLPVPFIFGPVGGAEVTPPPFLTTFKSKDQWFERIRALAKRMGEWDPFLWLTIRRSALVWVTTQDTEKRIQALAAPRVETLSESGLIDSEIDQLCQYCLPSEEPIQFISMGRLLHWKGFHLGIQAFAQANLPNATYWILGEGPEEGRLKQLVQSLGLGDRVQFLGKLPRAEGLQKLAQSHALVHPSLHDSGGWVCLEAMATGRPVICLDLGGPGTQVTSETGFKIPAHAPEQAIQDLAKAMVEVATNPPLRERMGAAGRVRIQQHYRWENRAELLTQTYSKILQSQSSKVTRQNNEKVRT